MVVLYLLVGEFFPQMSGGDSFFRTFPIFYTRYGCLALHRFPLWVSYDAGIGCACWLVVYYHCNVAANVTSMHNIMDALLGELTSSPDSIHVFWSSGGFAVYVGLVCCKIPFFGSGTGVSMSVLGLTI